MPDPALQEKPAGYFSPEIYSPEDFRECMARFSPRKTRIRLNPDPMVLCSRVMTCHGWSFSENIHMFPCRDE